LAQVPLQQAIPPPDFTTRLLARLPSVSPLELERQQQQHAQRRIVAVCLAIAVVLLVTVMFGTWLQPRWSDTSLGLATQALRQIAVTASVPLLLMVLGAAALGSTLVRVLRQPSARYTFGVALLACSLFSVAVVITAFADRTQAVSDDAAQPAAIATVLHPITVHNTTGDVVSLGGSITVTGHVQGDVVSLLGDVILAEGASIGGNVLVGNGRLVGEATAVAGVVRRGAGGFALASGVPGTTDEALSPNGVRLLTGLLGALIVFVLAALLIVARPHYVVNISGVLQTHPWMALGTGIACTLLLGLLLLPLLALLALTVDGLLLVPPLLLALHLPYVLGLAGLGQTLGERLTGAATTGSALWGVAAQMTLVLGLSLWMLPLGLLVFYVLASLGLGAHALSRRATVTA